MKISAWSDGHGFLPEINNDTDLVLIAGDFLPDGIVGFQYNWLNTVFRHWLRNKPPVIATPGNHCFLFQASLGIPNLDCTFLIDEITEFNGLTIYGTPWTPKFYNWAFMGTEEELAQKYMRIPEGLDILISHGPPYGYGDLIPQEGRHVGSKSLYNSIVEKRPTIVINGHIHGGHGQYRINSTRVLNVALTDEEYNIVNKPTELEFL